MKKIFFTALLFSSLSSFASDETISVLLKESNEASTMMSENASNEENVLFFDLCKYTVASLDDDGKVLEYLKSEKEVSGRTDCLKWVNSQLESYVQKGYCLGEEQVQYFVG